MNIPIPVIFEKIDPNAKIPFYASQGAACFDISSIESGIIEPGCQKSVGTGLAIQIPEKWEGQIRPRSGLAFSKRVQAFPGTIDSDYRGEVRILLENRGLEAFKFEAGDRIAQMKISWAPQFAIVEASKLDSTERGTGGFGHTGIRG